MSRFILILFLCMLSLNCTAQSKRVQDSLIKLPVTRYTENDTFVRKGKTIRLIKWRVINKRYYWKCSDGKNYPDILIDAYKLNN